MNTTLNFSHRDVWTTRGDGFALEVTHRKQEIPEACAALQIGGGHCWCVYAYIYQQHPLFRHFKGEGTWQPATAALQLHGGCTYLRRHVAQDGFQCSVQVGCDYQHFGDEAYSHLTTLEEVPQILGDVELLFGALSRMARAGVEL